MSQMEKVAVVTGGGTGIGKRTALLLANNGYFVSIAGRRLDPLTETIAEAGSVKNRLLAVQTDVGKPKDVINMFAKTKKAFGRLDLLFNNAGFGAPTKPLEDLSFEEWQSVVDTNLTGAFLCTQQAFKMMKEQKPQGGRIVNNGSIAAHVPRPNTAPYSVTKHGMTGLTKATSLDGRKYDIACGQIDIGNAATKMGARAGDGALQPNGSVVVEPTFDAERVAEAVLHMANLPLDTNILFMTIMGTKVPYVGRG